MLKIKKGLVNILEENRNNNEPEAAPQPPQPQTPQTHTALKLNELETPQPPQLLRSIEPAPPRQAARQACDQIGWEEHLMLALAKAPEDVAQKLVALIDREVLMRVLLQRGDDPYLKVALMLIATKK
ncbi:MAG: hypothetical protein ACO2PN_27060 [Pyrobaculum sp.]|jgi:hypothetical protein